MKNLLLIVALLGFVVIGAFAFEDYHRYFHPQTYKEEAEAVEERPREKREGNIILEQFDMFHRPPYFINPPQLLREFSFCLILSSLSFFRSFFFFLVFFLVFFLPLFRHSFSSSFFPFPLRRSHRFRKLSCSSRMLSFSFLFVIIVTQMSTNNYLYASGTKPSN